MVKTAVISRVAHGFTLARPPCATQAQTPVAQRGTMRRTVIVPLNLRMPAGGAMIATVVDTVWDFIIV